MEASIESESKLLRLPLFDGKYSKFQIWWTRFKAYAAVYGYAAALKIGGKDDLPSTDDEELDETIPAEKKKIAVCCQNAVAMANLTMAFTTEGAILLMYKAMNNKE